MRHKKNTLHILIIGFVLIMCNTTTLLSQEVMKIQKKDNTVITIPTSEISYITFTTSNTTNDENTVADIDGNTYKTVRIGNQVWMAENLRTTKYNDGSAINMERDDKAWGDSKTGAYCWYMNNIDNKNSFGALYNWQTIETDKLCPSGWHVPSHNEWGYLFRDLGNYAAAKLKEVGTANWKTTNTDLVTNETGFTALPGGVRWNSGGFSFFGTKGAWWSSTADGSLIFVKEMVDNTSRVTGVRYKREMGASVRCVRD